VCVCVCVWAQVIVGGDAEETAWLAERLGGKGDGARAVHTPKVKQVIDVSSTSNIVQVRGPPHRPPR
jgi:hypothetical protein